MFTGQSGRSGPSPGKVRWGCCPRHPRGTHYSEEEIPKAQRPRNCAAQALAASAGSGFPSGLLACLPALPGQPFFLPQLIPEFHPRGRKKAVGGDGRTQTDPQDSPSLRCHGNTAIFILLFMMLKALTFSVPERPGKLLPSSFNAAPSPKVLRRKKSNGGKGSPLGHPSTRGTVSQWFAPALLSFQFSSCFSAYFHIFKEIRIPCGLPERLLQRKCCHSDEFFPPSWAAALLGKTRPGSGECPVGANPLLAP